MRAKRVRRSEGGSWNAEGGEGRDGWEVCICDDLNWCWVFALAYQAYLNPSPPQKKELNKFPRCSIKLSAWIFSRAHDDCWNAVSNFRVFLEDSYTAQRSTLLDSGTKFP